MNFHSDGSRPIFVFGSNLAGRHGKGAAKVAYHLYGAEYGQGLGYCRASYAIPTKDEKLQPLPLWKIKEYIDTFVSDAQKSPLLHFHVTRIGCGLAGFKDEEIAPMFKPALPNCSYPKEWEKYLT